MSTKRTDAEAAGAENTEVQDGPSSSSSLFKEELHKYTFGQPFWDHLKKRQHRPTCAQYVWIQGAYMREEDFGDSLDSSSSSDSNSTDHEPQEYLKTTEKCKPVSSPRVPFPDELVKKHVSFKDKTEELSPALWKSVGQQLKQRGPTQPLPSPAQSKQESSAAEIKALCEFFIKELNHLKKKINELSVRGKGISSQSSSCYSSEDEEEGVEHHKHQHRGVRTSFSHKESTGRKRDVVIKEVSCTPLELVKIRKLFSRLPSETETEYVMRVSLTGGDHIMLSEQRARGYWGPGIILTTEDESHPWTLTQRAAFYVGSIDPIVRGEPRVLGGDLSNLLANVHKAAAIQMIYDRDLIPGQDSPVTLRVKPERLNVLIRGLPLSLRDIVIQIKEKLQNGDMQGYRWSDLARELLTYRRDYYASDLESSRKPSPVRQVTQPSLRNPPPPQQPEKSRGDWAVVSRGKRNRKPSSTHRNQHPENQGAASEDDMGPYAKLKEEARRVGIPPRLLSRNYSYQHLKDLVESWPKEPRSRSNSRERSCKSDLLPSPPSAEKKKSRRKSKRQQGEEERPNPDAENKNGQQDNDNESGPEVSSPPKDWQNVLRLVRNKNGDLELTCAVGPRRYPVTFVVDTGAQISTLKAEVAERCGVTLSLKPMFVSGAFGNSALQRTARVTLNLPGEEKPIQTEMIVGHIPFNLLGMDVLMGRAWRDEEGQCWSFGTPTPKMRLL
ncbi:uncharacterized protein LOC127383760 [Apus apus]|uniref:uncharacterized protein LOC127383760 n=1 Tax=Apus apus TaxID=8895 RepID=UPI0021F8FD40|nr:uncharacterized protein LOC127383760 [Apus apus]XP_051473158.1 uncharacterized protein LOC127383760 [Apus apus]XP_051473159.1 uncharacterized protein LOC127383760 [Apus apus]XP_051473161.1 uncharacterized protein LOC127383760 [Apus apus]